MFFLQVTSQQRFTENQHIYTL